MMLHTDAGSTSQSAGVSAGVSTAAYGLDAVLVREARGYGLTRERLRSQRWVRVSRGLYLPRVPERSSDDVVRAIARVLPRDSGLGHLTSAALRRWWLPHRLRPHVVMATTGSLVHVQRRGVYVRRSKFAESQDIDGVPVVSPAQTLVELARDLSLVDLVPMVDCALRDGTDVDAILEAARPRVPGSRRLRQAVALADERSESWWESILRLLHVLPGLGPVQAQVELWRGEVFIARADLHLVGTSRYPECDGGRHREKDRHDHDLGRDKSMSRNKHERYGYTTSEIAGQPDMVIRDAEDARGWPHDPRRVRTWWKYARVSSLTPYGRTRLAARLERYRLAAERRVAPSGCRAGSSKPLSSPLDAG
jgi:hypothetical protein